MWSDDIASFFATLSVPTSRQVGTGHRGRGPGRRLDNASTTRQRWVYPYTSSIFSIFKGADAGAV